MAENTYVLLLGALSNGQTADFAATSYSRLVTRVSFTAQGVAPLDAAGLQCQLKLDGVLLAPVYTLPQSTARIGIAVAGTGLAVAALSVLTVVVLANGTSNDVAFWIESTASIAGTADTWITPTAVDIQTLVSAPTYEVFTSTLLQTGQADPIPLFINDMVNKIRTAIRTGRRNNLGPVGTIPGAALSDLKNFAKTMLFSRDVAVSNPFDKSKSSSDASAKYLEKIEKGEIVFIEPLVVGEAVTGASYGFADSPLANLL